MVSKWHENTTMQMHSHAHYTSLRHLWRLMFKQDGVMIPFDAETEVKHGLKQVGKKFVFSINGVDPEDAGLYQVEVDGVKIYSTDFKGKMMHHLII